MSQPNSTSHAEQRCLECGQLQRSLAACSNKWHIRIVEQPTPERLTPAELLGIVDESEAYRALPPEMIAQLRAHAAWLETQEAALKALRDFAEDILEAQTGSLDGYQIQEIGVKHGVVAMRVATEPCGESCACAEFEFPIECYSKTEILMPKPPEAR